MDLASEKSIFLNAIELTDEVEREQYVREACGQDEGLRAGVEALLRADQEDENPLDQPPSEVASVAGQNTNRSAQVGSSIGPYRLMEKIGEGGFGLVFLARQESPVRRDVALKIIKPGMGTKEILARFEAERQAVAMMDHPNIASVFDAGVTESSEPYFVMELVRGVPVTDFVAAHELSIKERLALFLDVCAAVHHAHQKGVIHRDLKPSNVMVTLHDDRPVVKVIDFGVAKAIGQSLTEKTIYTRFFSMIGTPMYMSPEQAELSGLDVDTRSDLYSLGVILYELLTGETPFDRKQLDTAGLDELRRIIREVQPERPSRRVSTVGDAKTTVRGKRQLNPSQVSIAIRGDVDWIVMKALEKDRRRRYDSAAAMADDIRRHLAGKPIQARPPSPAYLISKFARRNRVALVTGAVLLTSWLVGTGVSVWQWRQAVTQRDQKDAALQKVERFADTLVQANSLVASAQLHADSGRWQMAQRDFDDAVSRQPKYFLPWSQRAQFFIELNLWEEAAEDVKTAFELGANVDSPQAWGAAILLEWTGKEKAALQFHQMIQQRILESEGSVGWDTVRNTLPSEKAYAPDLRNRIAAIAEERLLESELPGREPPGDPGLDFRKPPRRRSEDGRFGPQRPGEGRRDDWDRFDRPPPERSNRERPDGREMQDPPAQGSMNQGPMNQRPGSGRPGGRSPG
ncbi:MAG: protein kinase, partial [Planctomycetota bacterium]